MFVQFSFQWNNELTPSSSCSSYGIQLLWTSVFWQESRLKGCVLLDEPVPWPLISVVNACIWLTVLFMMLPIDRLSLVGHNLIARQPIVWITLFHIDLLYRISSSVLDRIKNKSRLCHAQSDLPNAARWLVNFHLAIALFFQPKGCLLRCI